MFKKNPSALIYDGVGTCAGCAFDMGVALGELDFEVTLIHPQANPADRITEAYLKTATMFIIPGGDDVFALKRALLPEEFQAIQDYVRNGGIYLGSCMGAYFASPVLGEHPNGEAVTNLEDNPNEAGLGLIQGYIGKHHLTPEPRVENIFWRGLYRWMYFQDGPEIYPTQDLLNKGTVEIWGRYSNGRLAAIQAPYGDGVVALLGPHPEANSGWFEEDHIQDPDGDDQDLFADYIYALLSKVSRD